MNVVRSSRYLLAVFLTLGLSAPLALAREKGNGNGDKKAGRPPEGAILGTEERGEKKGVEGNEEKSRGMERGMEERAEKKGVEGREERASRASRHQANGRLEMRFRDLDRNHDGVITRAEWRGGRAEFDRLDRNHDGVLTRDEFFRR